MLQCKLNNLIEVQNVKERENKKDAEWNRKVQNLKDRQKEAEPLSFDEWKNKNADYVDKLNKQNSQLEKLLFVFIGFLILIAVFFAAWVLIFGPYWIYYNTSPIVLFGETGNSTSVNSTQTSSLEDHIGTSCSYGLTMLAFVILTIIFSLVSICFIVWCCKDFCEDYCKYRTAALAVVLV